MNEASLGYRLGSRTAWDMEKDCISNQGAGCDGLRTERSCNNGARDGSDKLWRCGARSQEMQAVSRSWQMSK